MLGKTIIFKNFGTKTIVSAYTKPKKQSERQKENRSKFKDASRWAQFTLKDPERKAYYQKKAKKLHLPNAYTAAIADYMRKPMVEKLNEHQGITTFRVYKKDFNIVKTEVNLVLLNGETQQRTVISNTQGECIISLGEADLFKSIRWLVIDGTGKTNKIND
jgi:hypothetical protein